MAPLRGSYINLSMSRSTIFNKITSFLFIFFFLFTFLLSPADVLAQDKSSSGQDGTHGLQTSANAAGLNKYGSDVNTIAGNVIGWGLSLVGVVFFVLVVYGGILWMTARGNEDQVKRGRNTIIAASIGVVIVLASYAITNFVLQSLQGGQDGGSQAAGSGENQKDCTQVAQVEGYRMGRCYGDKNKSRSENIYSCRQIADKCTIQGCKGDKVCLMRVKI